MSRRRSVIPKRQRSNSPAVVQEVPLPDARPVAVDLFAGAGGFSLGALLAKIRVVAAVEKDKNPCATYRHNLIASGRSETKLFERDILDLDPAKFLKSVGIKRGDCDILLGGPPCQGFSSHRLNDSGVNDPRNSLLIHYFEYVKVLRPRYFLVENVPGMLWPRHRSYVETFYRLATENGYDLPPPYVLNACWYGVPQNRRRTFLFGRDRRRSPLCSWPPEVTHLSPDMPADMGNGGSAKPPWRLMAFPV
jgi:DNA (cytosine-5)-methyltransferase 1